MKLMIQLIDFIDAPKFHNYIRERLHMFGVEMCVIFSNLTHDDVIKWKNFSLYWPSLRGIHRSPVNSPHKGQWRRALMFSLICTWINGWENNRETGDLRRHSAHYGVTVMQRSTQENNIIHTVIAWVLSTIWHIQIYVLSTQTTGIVGHQTHRM